MFSLRLPYITFAEHHTPSVNNTISQSLEGDWGKIKFNLRYRYEYVDQAGLKTANGDPVRLRLGYLISAVWKKNEPMEVLFLVMSVWRINFNTNRVRKKIRKKRKHCQEGGRIDRAPWRCFYRWRDNSIVDFILCGSPEMLFTFFSNNHSIAAEIGAWQWGLNLFFFEAGIIRSRMLLREVLLLK